MGSWRVKAKRPAEAALQSHGHFAAGLGAEAFDAQPHAVDRPIHLDQRIDQRLTAFAGRLDGQLLAPPLHNRGRGLQDLDPPGRAQPAVTIAKQAIGGLKCLLDAGLPGAGHRGDQRAIKGGEDLGMGRVALSARNQ